MSTTPSKRRKLNHAQAQPSPRSRAHNLHFFFGKKETTLRTDGDDGGNGAGRRGEQPSLDDPPANRTAERAQLGEQDLTDEQLAWKLQAEWDAEEQRLHENKHISRDNANAIEGRVQHEKHQDLAFEAQRSASGVETADSLSQSQGASNDIAHPSNETLSLKSASAEDDNITYTIPFDQSPLSFDPLKYVPELRRQWTASSDDATYALLTHCYVQVNQTTSRIKIVDTLTNLLRTLIVGNPRSLLPAVWLATNSISPPYIDIELGLGGSAISKALKRIYGLDNAALKRLYNKYGDAGDVAFEAKKRQSLTLRKPSPLSIRFVFESLLKIANAKGPGCQEVKQRIVERLVQDARGAEESRYVVRTLVQHLRIGAVKTTMLIALSRAFLLSKPPGAGFPIREQLELQKLTKQELAEVFKPGEELLKASFARRPNYNDLIPALLDIGVMKPDEFLARCGLALHVPLRPMLGGITRDLIEMLLRLEGRHYSCEFKYDGQRAQVHCDSAGTVTIFSRHLEVMTQKYPDLVALVPQIRGDGVRSFILEGEVVAVDRETGDLKPFQILSNRARKDVVVHEVKVDVCLFAFDLMYLNGEELLDRTFRERRSLLRSLFTEIPHHFTWVRSLDATSEDADAINAFFKEATSIKCEGIMVKVLDNASERSDAQDGINKLSSKRKALPATYTPDKRLDSWLKVKKDYNNNLTDTLDLVPVGGWHGQGRKNKWWSPVLLACRNEEDGTLEVVTKCISGFTDAFYKAMRAKYDPSTVFDDDEEAGPGEDETMHDDLHQTCKKANVISRPTYITYSGPEPDVWFNPQEVWEIVFADITLSPTYSAARGIISEERGLSLRFPRFLKTREDKSVDEASTQHLLAELYRKQDERLPSADAPDALESDGDD